jgi:hypothetical protein
MGGGVQQELKGEGRLSPENCAVRHQPGFCQHSLGTGQAMS